MASQAPKTTQTACAQHIMDLRATTEAASKGVLAREIDLAVDTNKRMGKTTKDMGEAAANMEKTRAAAIQLTETIAAARLVGANLIMMRGE